MDIPLCIKRNYRDIVIYVDNHLKDYSFKNVNSREQFIHDVCHMVSMWFTLYHCINSDNLTLSNNKKYFIYIFRTKLSTYFDNHKFS